jgi:hypothetical protein
VPNPNEGESSPSLITNDVREQFERRFANELKVFGFELAIPHATADAVTNLVEAAPAFAGPLKQTARPAVPLEKSAAEPIPTSPHATIVAAATTGDLRPPAAFHAEPALTGANALGTISRGEESKTQASIRSSVESAPDHTNDMPSPVAPTAAPPSLPVASVAFRGKESSDPQPVVRPEAPPFPATTTTIREAGAEATPAAPPVMAPSLPSDTPPAKAPASVGSGLADSAAGTSFSDPKFGAASSGENSPNDPDRNPTNHASSSTTDRRVDVSSRSPFPAAAEQPSKVDPPAATPSPLPAAASDASRGAATAKGNEALGKSDPSDAAHPARPDTADTMVAAVPPAQMAAAAAKSDMKVAVHFGEFGAVELHAKVATDELSASITADHHEMHAQLSSDLPALQQALNDHHLRVNEILVLHNSLSSETSSKDGLNREREENAARQPSGSQKSSGGGSPLFDGAPNGRSEAVGIFDSKGRLSVRA